MERKTVFAGGGGETRKTRLGQRREREGKIKRPGEQKEKILLYGGDQRSEGNPGRRDRESWLGLNKNSKKKTDN